MENFNSKQTSLEDYNHAKFLVVVFNFDNYFVKMFPIGFNTCMTLKYRLMESFRKTIHLMYEYSVIAKLMILKSCFQVNH